MINALKSVDYQKELLISLGHSAFEVISAWPSFSQFHLAQDHEILKISYDSGYSVAHRLASLNQGWDKTPAAQAFEILSIAHYGGWTVAHELAHSSLFWNNTKAAISAEVLALEDHEGWTVAHELALNRPNWILSKEILNKNILNKKSEKRGTIAQSALLLNKDIGIIIYSYVKAGYVLKIDDGSHDWTKPAFKLNDISTFLYYSGLFHESIQCNLSKMKTLIHIYSTLKNIHKYSDSIDCSIFIENQYSKYEILIKEYLARNYYEAEAFMELNCEPALELISYLNAGRYLSDILTSPVNRTCIPLSAHLDTTL
jgi:hypothetical protein